MGETVKDGVDHEEEVVVDVECHWTHEQTAEEEHTVRHAETRQQTREDALICAEYQITMNDQYRVK